MALLGQWGQGRRAGGARQAGWVAGEGRGSPGQQSPGPRMGRLRLLIHRPAKEAPTQVLQGGPRAAHTEPRSWA